MTPLASSAGPILLQISQNCLGGEARLTATRLWWSFPSEFAKEEDLHLASQNVSISIWTTGGC